MQTLIQRIAYQFRPVSNREVQKTLQYLLDAARRSYRELDAMIFMAHNLNDADVGRPAGIFQTKEFCEVSAELVVQLQALARLQPLFYDYKTFDLARPSNQREAWLQVIYLLSDVQTRRTVARVRVPIGSHRARHYEITAVLKKRLAF